MKDIDIHPQTAQRTAISEHALLSAVALYRPTFLGAFEGLIRNIHGVVPVAELDGDEIGYLHGKVAEIKMQT